LILLQNNIHLDSCADVLSVLTIHSRLKDSTSGFHNDPELRQLVQVLNALSVINLSRTDTLAVDP